MSDTEPVELLVDYLWHTEMSMLINDAGAGDVWLPLSQIEFEPGDNIEDLMRGDTITIFAPEWLAKKNDLI